MARCAAPFYEPVPEYMRTLMLMGARFVTGNTGEGTDGSEESAGETLADEEPKPKEDATEEPADEEPAGDSDADTEEEAEEDANEFQSEGSKEAVLADLKKERTKRQKLQAALDSKTEELTTTVAEKDAAISQKDTEIHVLKLAIAHGIQSEEDLELLLDVKDQEKRDKLAERLGKAADKNFIIEGSGTGGGDVGGTVAAGRDLYNERRKK